MKFVKNIYCDLDNQYHSVISLCRLLKKLGINKKDYYDKNIKKENDGFCKNCGKETLFSKFGYRKYCDTKCSGNHTNNLKKLHKRCSSNPSLKKEVFIKMVETRNKNDPGMKTAMDKRKKTFKQKYNMTESEFRKKNGIIFINHYLKMNFLIITQVL